jgi:DNA-binding CsgD family transcriptional regulator
MSTDAEAALLAVAGLDAVSERIYLFVLHRLSITGPEVAHRFELDGAVVTARLEQLRDMGLVSRSSGDDAYAVVDPRVALSAVAAGLGDQVARLRDSIPHLADQFAASISRDDPAGNTRVIADRADVANWYVRMQHEATTELMIFDRPPYVSSPLEPLEAVVIARGIRWRGLYTPESFSRDGAWDETARLAEQGEESRIVPELPIKLVIADRRTALVSLSQDGVHHDALVTESPSLVNLLSLVFEEHWSRGLPLFTAGADDRGAHVALDEATNASGAKNTIGGRAATVEERSLLALIGAGLTDDAIAERLGISSRSLRRRTARLMEDLGAANRFRAGVEAARRGWV